jgi:hypothetical protein
LTDEQCEHQNSTADMQAIIFDLEDTILEYKSEITNLQPRVVDQISCSEGRLEWPDGPSM